METSSTVDQKPAASMTPQEVATLWLSRIEQGEAALKKWWRRGDKINNIYRSQSPSMQATSEDSSPSDRPTFNIFWSNTETLGPATYSRRPKVEAYRRFYDEDPVGRVAGLILERALQYELDCKMDFHLAMQQVVKDRLLPGMGQVWIRYEADIGTHQVEAPTPESPLQKVPQESEYLRDEFTPVDYVFWKDFIPSPARTWADLRWGARKVMFSKDLLEKRFGPTVEKFGGKIDSIPMVYDPGLKDGEKAREGMVGGETKDARACVYEIVDKESRQYIWVCKGCDFPLDVRADPNSLSDFFPFPPALRATTTNDELVPVADYIYYQDQIRELNRISARINLLAGSLRLIGVYDATATAISTLLSGGMENKLVPVNGWSALMEKGGLKGVIEWVPLEMVVKTLQGLYVARDQLKQEVYEITGMADIVRGTSQASETLGAQEIKAKFANLRLSSRQQQVAEFVTSILRIKGELMCTHYSPETILRISSAAELPEAKQYQEALAKYQQQVAGYTQFVTAQAGGQVPEGTQPPPEPGPAPRDIIQEALKLLKDEKTRHYRIEVAADSMVELEEVDERAKRNEFMSTVANFFNAMKNVTAVGPQMVPVALEMLRFVVRGFRVGRALESSIEIASADIRKSMENPPPPQPPETIQVAQLKEKGATERTQMEIASREKIEGIKLMAEEQERVAGERHEQLMTTMQGQQEAHAREREMAEAARMGQIERDEQARSQRQEEEFQLLQQVVQQAMAPQEKEEGQKLDQILEGQQAILEGLNGLVKAVRAPRLRKPTYGANGDIESVTDTIQEQE